MGQKVLKLVFVVLIIAIPSWPALSAEIGHFSPGVVNIRDFALPEPGSYGVIYNYGYFSDRLNDADGNKISSITVGGIIGPGVTFDVDVDISAYALAPAFIWVLNQKVFGGHYGVYVSPGFMNTSFNGTLSNISGIGRSASVGEFNIGDIFAQPLWLGWSGKHYDIAYGYGFYIPAGKYHTTTVTLPIIGDVTAEARDNIGLGFWTNQNQGSVYLYPWEDRRMAVENVVTWEIHRKKRGFDLTPGQNLTWNWGVSQYLPLKKDQSVMLELGPAGYSSFQVSDDAGSDARNPGVHDRVHAAGVQIGVTSVKPVLILNFQWRHEFSAVDRFQGDSIGLNFILKF